MNKKIKSIQGLEINAGERLITFVASSPFTDRDGDNVDTMSLRLPKKGGGVLLAKDLPPEGSSEVDIPLMLNHSQDVTDIIGSVRRAYMNDQGELIFQAGLSKRPIANEMLTLLEEGHLDNAFSITISDYHYMPETSKIFNAEVLEVSLVFRGSNKEARLLALKSLGEGMAEAKEKIKSATTDNYGNIKPEETTEEDREVVSEVEPIEELAPEKEEIKEEQEEEMHKENAKMAVMPKALAALPVGNADYLKTKSAMRDFADVLVKNAGCDGKELKKAWADTLKAKGVTNVEVLLPQALVTSITDALENSGTIWNVITKTGLTVRRIDANTLGINAETGRAKGHKKGADKTELSIILVDRVIRGQYIYAYLTLNKEDVRENQDSGALVKYVLETLTKRIVHEIERAIILGDGRSGDEKINSFKSILEDATDTNSVFASLYERKADEPLYKALIKASAELEAEGDIIAVMSRKTKADLKLSETANGNLVFPIGSEVAGAFEITNIFTPSWMNEADAEAVLFVGNAYETVGDNTVEQFQNFTLKANKLEYLHEIYAGGALAVPKSAVAIKKKAS